MLGNSMAVVVCNGRSTSIPKPNAVGKDYFMEH